ncbi:MAG: GTPase [Leptolyngbyaceae cyanobacterium RM2_2_4]|nr:GTPase [Leptolyngbyaceae cyanobacterium SM1_4_3]NJO49379.1 GTPase [Leptolyngbyaceae cyanobacterium RM2_2_4]
MEILRVIVTGTTGAGKTSFVHAVSEIEVIRSKPPTADSINLQKQSMSTLDFGRLTFDDRQMLHLYGIPGNPQLDFMWDILVHRAHACIVLMDAHRPQDFRLTRRIVSNLKRRSRVPMIVGLTHADCPDAWSIANAELALGLTSEQYRSPVVIVNATQPESVLRSLLILTHEMINAPDQNRMPLALAKR